MSSTYQKVIKKEDGSSIMIRIASDSYCNDSGYRIINIAKKEKSQRLFREIKFRYNSKEEEKLNLILEYVTEDEIRQALKEFHELRNPENIPLLEMI